jgi:zinc-binding alcohol dehydrogenase family protein
MRAVAYLQCLPSTDPACLVDVDLPTPNATGRDLLVRVHAVSVNPVDTKLRRHVAPSPGETRVLGFDVAGVVEAVGPDVTLFQPGQRVWYAGARHRPGANAELHLVDERLVGRMPATLDFAQAAAMPLTTITAWELLFDRLGVPQGGGAGQALLIVGGAGGVGSMLIQLARQLTQLRVVATASRPETVQWCHELGAHDVIDHRQPLAQALRAQTGLAQVELVASLTQTDQHFPHIVELLAPQGRLALIDDPQAIDIRALKQKSISLHWESMFTRSLFQTADMPVQGQLLATVAQLVDAGRIRSTQRQHLGRITAENLRQAHVLQESGTSIGKTVLEGF